MTILEFEQKCKFLASTPEASWFDMRFKPFQMMLQTHGIKALSISTIFPSAGMLNFTGYCFKIESKYYFFLVNKSGNVIECFNVEYVDFDTLDNILGARILLSSDDSKDRIAFVPLLMTMHQMKTKSALKSHLDDIFRRAI